MPVEVTILIPNYRTPEITKICLRLIRKHTNLEKAKVIVIDNDSQDESIDYLRSLKWITLLEREPKLGESPPLAHSCALDLGFGHVDTPYVLSIHTDTFIKRDDWLDVLIAPFHKNPNISGVGSWKLESKNLFQIAGYKLENTIKFLLSSIGIYKKNIPKINDTKSYYLRSHCAIYRTEIINELATSFSDEDGTAGSVMHKKMVAAGYEMLFLDSAFLGQYVDHINHATMVLNPELGSSKKNVRTGKRRMKKMLRGIDVKNILASTHLDN